MAVNPARSVVISAALSLAAAVLLTACGSSAPASAAAGTSTSVSASGWVDQDVTFQAGGVTIYATYRHPRTATGARPAVLLIAGSGPTDRNGNSPLVSGSIDTLKTLADWLSADGVASLRYDKLGSGQTGLGPYRSKVDSIGIAPFEAEAAAALRFLAAQPGVERAELGVIGHSEGALYALLLADGDSGSVPPVHALGLLEPLSARYLDIISDQLNVQITAARQAGQLTAAQAASLSRTVAATIAWIRAQGTVPAGLPSGLSSVFNASTALYLQQADRYDPAVLGARLPAGTPVLVSCSNADIQVTCGEVQGLVTGLDRGPARVDFVHLDGVDHVLKQDPSRTAANYGEPLPFSPQLEQDLRAFVRRSL